MLKGLRNILIYIFFPSIFTLFFTTNINSKEELRDLYNLTWPDSKKNNIGMLEGKYEERRTGHLLPYISS